MMNRKVLIVSIQGRSGERSQGTTTVGDNTGDNLQLSEVSGRRSRDDDVGGNTGMR